MTRQVILLKVEIGAPLALESGRYTRLLIDDKAAKRATYLFIRRGRVVA
jgi:hypothetical protein